MRLNPHPVEEFFSEALKAQLPQGFEKFREASDLFQKSSISLGFLEAGLLQMLVRLHNRPRWVEIGTLTGFSAFCLARALPEDGHLWTLEKSAECAARARELLVQEGLGTQVTVVAGDAALTLRSLESEGPFDGLFIDGNKAAYGSYLDWAENNLADGGLILADNVFLGGALLDGSSSESKWSAGTVKKMRGFLERLFDPSCYQASLIPTAEGLVVARLLKK